MKSPILIILLTSLIYSSVLSNENAHTDKETYNLRHRDLGGKSRMCIDLGKRKGLHNMKVSKKKFMKKLADFSNAEEGWCQGPTKKLKASLTHEHKFCALINGKDITIKAPEGMRKWLLKTVGADKDECVFPDGEVRIWE